VLAHLKRQEAGKDAARKLSVKKELVWLLYERGYKRGDIMHLLKFLDWLVCLPPGVEERFEDRSLSLVRAFRGLPLLPPAKAPIEEVDP